jgi:hypothetical protein
VQEVLEKACYLFAEKHMPHVLETKGWDCIEAVELQSWMQLFHNHLDKFDPKMMRQCGVPDFHKILVSVSRIRHIAVHRERINGDMLNALMADAERISNFLKEPICQKFISSLAAETRSAMVDFQAVKDALQAELAENLDSIEAQRAELDRKESEAVERMVSGDRAFQMITGKRVEEAIMRSDSYRITTFCAPQPDDQSHHAQVNGCVSTMEVTGLPEELSENSVGSPTAAAHDVPPLSVENLEDEYTVEMRAGSPETTSEPATASWTTAPSTPEPSGHADEVATKNTPNTKLSVAELMTPLNEARSPDSPNAVRAVPSTKDGEHTTSMKCHAGDSFDPRSEEPDDVLCSSEQHSDHGDVEAPEKLDLLQGSTAVPWLCHI